MIEPANHRETMLMFARRYQWKRGAELGLGKGHLFALLLASRPRLFLIGVDRFVKRDRLPLVQAIAAQYPDRCVVHACATHEAAALVADGSLDFVFIDAGHSYEAVKTDIADWWPKVRARGWFGGHDYHETKPGVIQAVDEAFGDTVQHAQHAIWWVRKTQEALPWTR